MTTKIEEIIKEYENARLMITRPSDYRHYSPGTTYDEFGNNTTINTNSEGKNND